MTQTFDFSRRVMTPTDSKNFEGEVLKAVGTPGSSMRLAELVEKCAPLDPTGLGVSSTRMAVLHLVEQGLLSLQSGMVTVLKKTKKRKK